MTIIERPSPNKSDRRGATVNCIVLHDTGGRTAEGALTWMESPTSGVSSHYVVGKDGQVWRLVPEGECAWHAGESVLFGRKNVNSFSVGIEMVDDNDGDPYPKEQITAVIELCADIYRRHPGVTLHRIIGHEHVAPGRKVDPGRDWPWRSFLLDVAKRLIEDGGA